MGRWGEGEGKCRGTVKEEGWGKSGVIHIILIMHRKISDKEDEGIRTRRREED